MFVYKNYVYSMYKMYLLHVESLFSNSQWTCPSETPCSQRGSTRRIFFFITICYQLIFRKSHKISALYLYQLKSYCRNNARVVENTPPPSPERVKDISIYVTWYCVYINSNLTERGGWALYGLCNSSFLQLTWCIDDSLLKICILYLFVSSAKYVQLKLKMYLNMLFL